MTRKNILATAVVSLFLVAVLFLAGNGINKSGGLIGPNFIQQITHSQPVQTSVPIASPNAPKTFNFDSATDLKVELDEVNPQVLDSDFE